MLPVVDENPMAPSALPTADSYTFFSAWEKKSPWKNDVTVKTYELTSLTLSLALPNASNSIEAFREYEPAAHIHHISPTPLLMTVAEKDHLTPADLALAAFERARQPKELHILKGGHFDGYSGPYFQLNAGRQVEFLKKYLCESMEAGGPQESKIAVRKGEE